MSCSNRPSIELCNGVPLKIHRYLLVRLVQALDARDDLLVQASHQSEQVEVTNFSCYYS